MVEEFTGPEKPVWRRLISPGLVRAVLFVALIAFTISYLTKFKAQQIAIRNSMPDHIGWVHGTSDGRLQRAIDEDDRRAVSALIKVVPRQAIKDNIVERVSYDRTCGTLEALIDAGWSANGVNEDGATVVAAVRAGQVKALETLLRRGANPNATQDTRPAVIWAAGFPVGADEMLALLAHHGVKLDEVVSYVDAGRTPFGMSSHVRVRPICIAAQRGNLPAIRKLISVHARVNGVPGEDMPPIVAASVGGDPLGATKILLAAGAHPDATGHAYVRDERWVFTGHTASALYFNAAMDHPRTVKLLVEKGADLRAKADDGKTPVEVAKGASLKFLTEYMRTHGTPAKKG